ncbi:50S ribosomal protein L17 [Campylobacter sp. 19-13652]|uniref:50S ribosomal protein L17 n=1 Tax=Campylobacter sp. 19-13652 TaxID=2840180 RepID=UPI001C763AD9|nr:50S ribosomal protein L17 [Campylobacter sp. 19-13652]BCX80225.1 50S ribosomal protein L17 [Campylobacter sp. 19-13652]
MRHGHGYRKLGRTSSHRAALLKNLAIAIIKSEKIETTLPKAKELRSYVEKLITRARKGDSNAHRAVFASIQDKASTNRLVTEVAPKYVGRNGGYTRIVKTRLRRGDAAQMATIELVSAE